MVNWLHVLGAAGGQAGTMDLLSSFLWFVPLVAVLYFLMIRPQRKREKAQQQMRNQIEVADEIVTIGGIIGRVVSIREDSIVVETGSDRSKIRISKWAVQTNNTVHERAELEKAEKAKKEKKNKNKDE